MIGGKEEKRTEADAQTLDGRAERKPMAILELIAAITEACLFTP
jgi:hypothetical protein